MGSSAGLIGTARLAGLRGQPATGKQTRWSLNRRPQTWTSANAVERYPSQSYRDLRHSIAAKRRWPGHPFLASRSYL